jgi:hypothetical protein
MFQVRLKGSLSLAKRSARRREQYEQNDHKDLYAINALKLLPIRAASYARPVRLTHQQSTGSNKNNNQRTQ